MAVPAHFRPTIEAMRGNALPVLLLLLIAVALVALLAFNHDGKVAGMDEDQFARLAYLGIWGLVVGSGVVFFSRLGIARALKDAAIWTAGFVLLIGVYAYRAEFREIVGRMTAELVPGHAVAVAGSGGRGFMVTRGADKHFHVKASLDGTTLDLLVDTGASVVVLDRGTADKLGIDTGHLAFGTRVETANGIADAQMVRLKSVQVGDILRENVEAAVMKSDGVSLLGMSFLGTLSSFEFRGERLVLTD